MATPSKKSIWTEETTAIVVDAYTAKLEAEGKEAAANNEFLLALAKQVGAPSEKSVRGKLTTAGVYQRPDAVASVAKTNQVRKEHHIRALANSLGLDADDIDSLKNAKMDALAEVNSKLGITDVMAASATGYTIEPVAFVYNLMVNMGVTFDDLGELIADLAE